MAAKQRTDSQRSAQTCFICDAPNSLENIQCKACAAPLSIVEDAAAQKRDPTIVSILGDSNSGKTVYLGFLMDLLSQRANDFEAIPRAGYAVELQQRVISYMANRMFPPKTPIEADQWSWAYYRVCRHRSPTRWVDLIMPDLAGEAVAAEIASPWTFRVIHNLLAMARGTMLIVDAAQTAAGSTQPDFFALKCLSYIENMHGKKGRQRVTFPIAVVLSKADHCSTCFDDPRGFAEANLNRLWNMCQSRFSNVEFFACSVVGSLAYAASEHDDYVRPIPLHTSLRGVMEPFEWMFNQLSA
ncbi:MAG: hypothetical protein O7D91_14365 [Planctomycetota bacterium]|jgi:hypothetical protein|nr:hypothetical protein [Planctomycetota bacterium]